MSKALYKRDWTKQRTIWMVRDQTCTWKKMVSKEELCKRDMAKQSAFQNTRAQMHTTKKIVLKALCKRDKHCIIQMMRAQMHTQINNFTDDRVNGLKATQNDMLQSCIHITLKVSHDLIFLKLNYFYLCIGRN